MLLSSALFARAIERGNPLWWAVYAVSAAVLPLTHPIAASALAAQILALVVARREVDLRLAVPAIGVATVECTLFLAAAVLDRADAGDGAGPLELGDVGFGVGRALGWSPVVAALAVWGMVTLYRRSAGSVGLWKAVLVAGLAVIPLLAVLVAGIALPVFPRAALTVAAGGVALAAGIGLVAIPDRGLRLASLVAVAAVAIAALANAATQDAGEDWRTAARVVRARTTPRDTVVVLPERALPAFAYYAPDVRTSLAGGGEGVTVVVAGDPEVAVATARRVVSPPRFALLAEEPAGERLVVRRCARRRLLGRSVAVGPREGTDRSEATGPRQLRGGQARAGPVPGPGRRAEVDEHAVLAERPPGVADAASVPDEQMREPRPVGPWNDPLQVALDPHGILVSRQAQPLGETPDMGVDHDPLRVAELRGDDVRGLSRDARKSQQILQTARHLAVELLEEDAHRATDRLRLLTVEAGRVDVALELLGRDCEVVLRPAVLPEQVLRNAVDVHVGGLRRQHHGDQKLDVALEAEGDRGILVLCREPGDGRADAFRPCRALAAALPRRSYAPRRRPSKIAVACSAVTSARTTLPYHSSSMGNSVSRSAESAASAS